MLLPIDAADIRRVELVRISSSREWDEWDAVPGETLGTAEGAAAEALVELVAGLPDGESMRCFIPVYALKVHGAADVLVEIAFCFRCHNALVVVPGGGRPGLVAFEPDSPAGRKLLARFKAADPAAPTEA
ncbi:hypothetical protein [Amycolatopsis sp. lyj-109]|uniref:hypothetical protein n=1 Tax=Amycolatopsis sp. lyj-109 TaxID=2789287 RepID=UPI00397962A7